ncbi:MAG: glycosyltransferase family 4 protein [Myxococcota bacterium]
MRKDDAGHGAPRSRGRVAFAAFEAFPNRKGAGRRITETTRALADAGWEVHLITLPPRAGRQASEVDPRVTHHPLRAYAQNYLERALFFRAQVARRLRTLAPDVVHVRGIFEGQAAAEEAARRGIPYVFEANGLPSVELRYHYPAVGQDVAFEARLRRMEAEQLERATHVVTQSRHTLAFLRGRGLPAATPTAVIPNGADPEVWPPGVTRPGLGTRVLYAGTLSSWQGVAELFMALRRARRVVPLELTVAGHASRRRHKQVVRMLRRLKITDAVSLTGALSPSELVARVREADICVAPLRRDGRNGGQGCSPIKLYEYMAAERAIITTDLACIREIVTPEKTAVVVHAPRPARLAEQLVRLAQDPELRTSLGRRARQAVIAAATWSHRRRRMASFYAGLFDRHG